MTISHHNFNELASGKVEPKKKREAPFSLRLNFEERAALHDLAGDMPLNGQEQRQRQRERTRTRGGGGDDYGRER